MEICYRYSVSDAVPEDFLLAIDPSRLVLEDKIISESGREVSCDIYDPDGNVTNRTAFYYDEAGNLIRKLDFVGDFTTPFKEEARSYSASGKLLSVEIAFEGEPGSLETHHYDHLDRLQEVVSKEFDGEDSIETTRYQYSDASGNHATEEVYHGDVLVSRIRSVYNEKGQNTEEYHEVPNRNYAAFQMRYYWNNEKPNNVFSEKYDERGHFLEESREWYDSKNNLIKRSTHTDDHAESEPHFEELYEYSTSGFRISKKYARNGSLEDEERVLLDENNRVARVINSNSNQHIITCYRYEMKE